MFEILIGRTPFEANEQEEFSTPEDLAVYYERSRRGQWIGEWEMPHGTRCKVFGIVIRLLQTLKTCFAP